MYAYIKFIEDGIFATVDTKNIRRFDPSCISYDKKYMIKWSDDEYYPAIIIYVKETKQEIQDEVKKKRVATKPISFYASATDDSEDDQTHSKTKLQKQVVLREHEKTSRNKEANKVKVWQQKCDADILTEYKEKITDQSKQTQKKNSNECSSRDTEARTEITKNEIMESLKITLKEKEKEIVKLTEKTKDQKKIIAGLSDKNKNQELQIVELTKLNIALQKEAITVVTELAEKIKGIDINSLANQNGLMEIGQIVGDEVHIGQSIMLKKSQFDACFVLAKTASKFAKDMALAVFGVETLRNSSITGRKGNRVNNLSKPPLDPTKLQAVVDIFIFYKKKKGEAVLDLNKETEYVKAYITSKISDLNRQPRVAAGNKTKKAINENFTDSDKIEAGTGVETAEKDGVQKETLEKEREESENEREEIEDGGEEMEGERDETEDERVDE